VCSIKEQSVGWDEFGTYLNIKHEWATKRYIFPKKYKDGVLEKLKIK